MKRPIRLLIFQSSTVHAGVEEVALSRKLGAAAQQRAEALFTVDRQLDLTAKLLRDILAETTRASD